MIAATRFIDAIQARLSSELVLPGLSIGVAEPLEAAEIPAVVISLEDLHNPSRGLGAHREIKTGALAERTAVNLASPVLTDEPSVSLVDGQSLFLLHGGLVDSEGSNTPLQAADIQVQHNGVPFTLVAGAPVAGQFVVEPQIGRLTFGEALPGSGLLEAEYFIGRWERVVHQLQGRLHIQAIAANNVDAESLSELVYDALTDPAISGLRDLEVVSIAPVTVFRDQPPLMRVRVVQWEFDFEAVVDLPDASGGIIERVRMNSQVDTSGFETEDITVV